MVNVPIGSWVVSYWSDKSGTTTAWTPDASVTTRLGACGADGGRICSALADCGGPLPAGAYGNIAATTNAASDTATMWSFVLAAADGPPANQAPTADFAVACTLLDCAFDSSASADSTARSCPTPGTSAMVPRRPLANPRTHTALRASYDVTLTVTDNEGATDDLTTTVEVAG